jgi:hypothetical protein
MFDFPDPLSPVIELKLSSLQCVSDVPELVEVNIPAGDDSTNSVRLVALGSCQLLSHGPTRLTDVYDEFYDPHGGRICCCC